MELMDYLMAIFDVATTLGATAFLLFFGTCFIRLESFTQRRLLVRFNRKTRKVYVHRPVDAGGITELDWDKVIVDGIDPKGGEAGGVGVPLILIWHPDHTPSGLQEVLMVGRQARSNSELTNIWEFVRRYMEDGPQAVPRPRLIGKFPWPWRSIQSALSLVWPIFRIASLKWMMPLLILISPAILIFAAGNWISLLTCWEPRWPRAIREACGGH